MRAQLEMVTASLMQNMVQIRKNNTYFVTKLLFKKCWKKLFGALGVESRHGGAIVPQDLNAFSVYDWDLREVLYSSVHVVEHRRVHGPYKVLARWPCWPLIRVAVLCRLLAPHPAYAP